MAKKTDNYVEDEVSEEVAQAVAVAIVEEADERNSDVETIVNELVEEFNEDDTKENLEEKNKNTHISILDYRSRGFETEDDARNFINTEYFKNLGEADKKEFIAWLEK